MQFNVNNTKRIIAVDKRNGLKYVVGSTTILDAYDQVVTQYTNYTFRLEGLTLFEGKVRFRVVRCNTIVGDETTLDLIFED